jgi:hypothetical protein
MDGKPLPNVAVTFMPAGEGGTASGKTDANGKYELSHANGKGAPVGKNKVSVTTVQQTEAAVDMSQIPSDSPEYAKSMGASQNYNVTFTETIPAKYNVKTELQFDVKSGSQVIDLKLESGGGGAAAPASGGAAPANP